MFCDGHVFVCSVINVILNELFLLTVISSLTLPFPECPLTSLPSSYISPHLLLSTLVYVRFLFLQGHIQPGWHTASNCVLTCITVFPPCCWPKWQCSGLSDKYGFKAAFHHENCDFSFLRVDGVEHRLPLRLRHLLGRRELKKMWRCRRREKQSADGLEGGVHLCVVHDIFLHFKTLELCCCQHDG